MADCILIKLKNMTPLPMGTGKENYDFAATTLQSDTLSAALASMKALRGECDNLDSFLGSFVISSAFPYIDNRYFLPKPIGRINLEISDGDAYVAKKKIKKLKFIEWDLWAKLMKGQKLLVKERQLQGHFLITDADASEAVSPYRAQVNQRATVPLDQDKETEPFFFEWTYFHPSAGLYCLVKAPETMQADLISLFKQLGEVGVGTDKNIGGGKFDVEVTSISLPEIKDADSSLLLSLYIPTEDEISDLKLKDSSYDLFLRGGYMAGSSDTDFMHLRKKSVYMFNVGSVFKTTEPLKGKVVDLRPDWNDERLHPVFRSGRPFTILIKQPEL